MRYETIVVGTDGSVNASRARPERYLEERGVDHESDLVNGHPASAILDLAENTGADRIVVGSRGLGMATRCLRGSTSAHIVNHAPLQLPDSAGDPS